MIILYLILICLILFLLILTFVFWFYQKRLTKVVFKNYFNDSLGFIEDDIGQVDSSYEVPEIISSFVLEETSDVKEI